MSYLDQREEGMEEDCIGREGPQRNVVLDKKKKKKWKKKKKKRRRRRSGTCWGTNIFASINIFIFRDEWLRFAVPIHNNGTV